MKNMRSLLEKIRLPDRSIIQVNVKVFFEYLATLLLLFALIASFCAGNALFTVSWNSWLCIAIFFAWLATHSKDGYV